MRGVLKTNPAILITVNISSESAAPSGPLYEMNLIPYVIWFFINLVCIFWDVLLMSLFKGKKFWNIRVQDLLDKQSDEFLWTRLFGSISKLENFPVFYFLLSFSIIKGIGSRRRWMEVYISMRRTL